jgi:hemerythrin
VKFETRQQVREIVQADHDALKRILADRPRCLGNRTDISQCDYRTCGKGDDCHFGLRQFLHQLMNGVLVHFQHEQQGMKQFNSTAHTDMHMAHHAEMTQIIKRVAADLLESYDPLKAIAGIQQFVDMYRRHIDSTDAAMQEDSQSPNELADSRVTSCKESVQ